MTNSVVDTASTSVLTLNSSNTPKHIAIIMDGNGRWAKKHNKMVSFGHREGAETVRKVLSFCKENAINVVTLFAFSSENWARPKTEVKALMALFASYLKSEVSKLNKDSVRVRFIGDRSRLNPALVKQMDAAEQLTANNYETTLVIAVDYGGQWDIANAAKKLAKCVEAGQLTADQISVELLDAQMSLADLPKPDLCIRTAGEQRISNFLLWQLAYAELYFTKTLWPDFSKQDMELALKSFRERDRRFGGRNQECESGIETHLVQRDDQSA